MGEESTTQKEEQTTEQLLSQTEAVSLADIVTESASESIAADVIPDTTHVSLDNIADIGDNISNTLVDNSVENIAESVAATIEATDDTNKVEEPEAPISDVLKPILENDILEIEEEIFTDPWTRLMTVEKVENLLKNSSYPEGIKAYSA